MLRTATTSSLRFLLLAFALSLVAMTALTGAETANLNASPQASTVLRTVVSAGRPTGFTDLDQLDQDAQADRIGEIFGAALMLEGNETTSFHSALRSIESQFLSIQVQPKGVKYCYEYDPILERHVITCKEVMSASIVENPGDTAVVVHLEVVTEI